MARDTFLLHPHIQEICRDFIYKCKLSGIDVIITQTLRTKAEQDSLYAQGRTKPGNIVTKCRYPMSPHCWGCAFDIAVKVDGKVTWGHPELYRKAGQIGKSLGLVWGGDFKSFIDTPHFEDPKYVINKSVSTLIHTWNTPEKFIDSWKHEEEEEVEIIKVVVGASELKGFIKDGISYAPVKQLAETFNAKVTWNAEAKKVTVIK